MRKHLQETVLQYAANHHRHTVQVHTFDGMDVTFQSSGAGDEAINLHKQASMALDDLRHKVGAASLPLSWLLDVTITVESYDRIDCKAVASDWAVVYVPMKAKAGDTTLRNIKGLGFQVVNISETWRLFPDAQALHIEIGV